MAKIAILGFGVVGSGTVEVFYKNRENLEKKAAQELDIKYILDIRDYPDSPYKNKFIKDFDIILNDPEITVVAELIGGNTFAYDYALRALKAGKNVVTSNKELVATKGAELLKIAREKAVSFFFEASVGGGIPIIRPLHQCLLTDKIDSIAGILNGTTNYILTKMSKEGISFENALKTAQELGYAERDPSADIEGHDTCRKICILASLASGSHVYPENVKTTGIKNIKIADIEYARSAGYSVKLIGRAEFSDSGKNTIETAPVLVHSDSQLSGVNDVFNAILIRGESTGEVLFYGKGAGKYPTASAVVADIINALKPENAEKTLFWEDSFNDTVTVLSTDEIESSFYLYVKNISAVQLREIFDNIIILSRPSAEPDETAIIIDKISEKNLKAKCADIEILNILKVL